ncbi:heparin lyase I family protein [Winogradskyella wichelsiae]|uniref:heparin lyase I family protein n=1 Tax=Winogradskyella wichelsiae TaxID=2697007 RepID=UPI003EFB1334
MKRIIILLSLSLLGSLFGFSQTILNANEPGNTYEEINSILAPNYNAVEVPDCVHTDFGRHINEVFDTDLNSNVFRFIAHKTPDNDRCVNFDRQRVEIKTYASSPENLKATEGETVEYKWKFKLPSDFQVSSDFTHIHQIKSVGGPYASIPMITLTLRKSNPDRIELRHTSTNSQNTIKTAELDLLRGHWVEVTETITFDNEGSYSININRISNNISILSYSNEIIDTWQDGATFARPKWGIYRSLNNIDDLQDEAVSYANFSIEEIEKLSIFDIVSKAEQIILVSNPSKESVTFKNVEADDYDSIILYNSEGKIISAKNRLKKHKLDVSDLKPGLYYIVFMKLQRTVKVLKCLVN